MTEQADVIVVGGGQAGLTAGYYLTQAKIPFVILHAGLRVGDSWRQRWDSLTLSTPAVYSGLPGLPFPGHPEHYPGNDEVADYLEQYPQTHELPIRYDSRVNSLESTAGGYRLQTQSGTYEAARVIVATVAYQRPYIPPISEQLGDEVTQLHSAEYRNPNQLSARDVLVVGAANAGAQIAEDLAPTHRVHLSPGARIPRLPRRVLGKSVHWYGDHLGLIAASLDSWWTHARGDTLIGNSLRQLKRHHDVELVDRTVDAHERTVTLEDGRALEVQAVVWATGYRPAYSWIHVPVLDERGALIHRRGVTDAPGPYFVWMKNQYSRGSSLLHWVREDAAHIVQQVHEAGNSRRGER